jgi:hypothetical protein
MQEDNWLIVKWKEYRQYKEKYDKMDGKKTIYMGRLLINDKAILAEFSDTLGYCCEYYVNATYFNIDISDILAEKELKEKGYVIKQI